MAAFTVIQRIIIVLYVTSSLEIERLSHAQTVGILRESTWHMTSPPYMGETGNNSKQVRQAYWKSFKYVIDIKINASREMVQDRLRTLLQGYTYPNSVNRNVTILNVNLNTTPPPKLIKYIIDFKINASNADVIERLRGLINGKKFPNSVKKCMQISSANITTVCLSDANKTECKCENQYVWSSEQCSKQGVCSHNQNATCGCINSAPTDGTFCQRTPAPPLKSFKYTIDFKINSSREDVIERFRALIHGQNFPISIKNCMQLSSVNITNLCLSNANKTECKCENQYVWSSEQCCSHNPNSTCEFVNTAPVDGIFCQRTQDITTPATPNTTEIITTMASPSASTSTEIPTTLGFTTLSTLVPNTTHGITTMTSTSTFNSTAETSNITTPATPNTTEIIMTVAFPSVSSSTEIPNFPTISTLVPNTTKGVTTMTSVSTSTPTAETSNVTILTTLFTNSTEIIKTSATPTSIPQSQTSTIKHPTPITKPTSAATTEKPKTKPPPAATTEKPTIKPPPTTTKPPIKPPPTATKPPSTSKLVIRHMSLGIKETFNSGLNNKASEKFKEYKSKIETAITKTYEKEDKFVSATVTGFRPGSVIVDFFITSSQEIQSNEAINQALSSNLKLSQFDVDPASISVTERTNLVTSREAVFPEQIIQLYCPDTTDRLGKIEWTVHGKQLGPPVKGHYELSPDGINLTVNNVNNDDNGRYECSYKTDTGLYLKWDEIDFIKPYPSIQTPVNKTLACDDEPVQLSCCVHPNYTVNWVEGTTLLSVKSDIPNCITYMFNNKGESCGGKKTFICKLGNEGLFGFSYSSKTVELDISEQQNPNTVICNDEIYGFGKVGLEANGDCEGNKIGSRKGICQPNGTWKTFQDDCVLRIIEELKQESQALNTATLTTFLNKVNNATTKNEADIVQSSATVTNLVEILKNIASVSQTIQLDEFLIEDFLQIVEVISSEATKLVWANLNAGSESQGNSSELLNAIENVLKASNESNDSFSITSPKNTFLFRKITTSDRFFKDVLKLNSTAEIDIPDISSNVTIITAAFSTLNNIMPVRNRTDNSNKSVNVINGLIVVVKTSVNISNISLSFQKLNNSGNLANPQCVFWDFNLFNGNGGWDSTGCERIHDNGNITCRCNHTTSFSILMSPSAPKDPALSVITYVGVAISLASLVVCLIIEIIIWKDISRNSTSHMRHVFIVNVALSLLIADVLFIIGAAISNPGKDIINLCSAVAFFTHYFYLALFFWMLVSALLLLYRTTMVFSQMSKSVMMAIAFSVGYGAPLIISIITVAVTGGSKTYITRSGICWLNWDQSKALLAFVVPALVIVAVNIVIVIIVVIKLVRRRVGENSRDERNVLTTIVRCVAILTPIFGITWGLGLGILVQPKALVIHYLFAIFNSLQGLFILVLGILMEKKVREALTLRLRHIGSKATHSSSYRSHYNNNNSTSNRTTLTNIINNLLRRDRYAVSPANSHSRSSEYVMTA
ncbi:adhesion G protein-coupled receptor F5 isoform X24 [Xyrauchen texanus]|uniref:adhesion G protein-coupled receptor F5 isoform X20 n=1 Tax=Xyrauchen texanus TaxID=154827 RepID=UPI00224266F9|nr:adhesion G protein-coupled receptor F5 isoform X20 [Xyrauchen texanus]XP_051963881.1 adhesion G protein-coupled receptor F5 isoform X22 [Xyrauchen texanus]XP_051963882.1 adhesion G protein-coupled receptor F5 isoform X23 [Xyrauchen texanus]XP_051963883.1 adhesion G protein-coupled receptor F5 isoform X24 [Xyrauchen texanus]